MNIDIDDIGKKQRHTHTQMDWFLWMDGTHGMDGRDGRDGWTDMDAWTDGRMDGCVH